MRPVLIAVAGGHSGAGKTETACKILRFSSGWGAIKVSRTPLYSSITTDSDILLQEGKDTRRYLDAGAERVLWIQSAGEDLKEVLSQAIEMLSDLEGIVIEGNSAVLAIAPEIVIFVQGDKERVKDGSEMAFQKADIVIVNDEASEPPHPSRRVFCRKDEAKYLEYLRMLVGVRRGR